LPMNHLKDKTELKPSKNAVIKKANYLAEARYKLELPAQKILEPLLAEIHPEDDDFKRYTLRLSDLYDLLGVNNQKVETRRAVLTRAIHSLQQNLVKFTEYNEIRQEQLVAAAWLETTVIEWDADKVTLRISEKLKPFLLLLKERFYRYRWREVADFKREYSSRLLQLCKRYSATRRFNHGNENGLYLIQKTYELDELRLMLEVPPDIYTTYTGFKIRILDMSRHEVEEKTDCRFTFRGIRTGRKITKVEFTFFGDQVGAETPTETPGIPHPEPEEVTTDGVSRDLMRFGVSDYTIRKINANYTPGQINQGVEAACDYAAWLRKKKREEIKFPDTIIKKALEEGWTSAASRARRKLEEDHQKLTEKMEAANILKNLADRKKKLREEDREQEAKIVEEQETDRRAWMKEHSENYRFADDKTAYLLMSLPEKDRESLNEDSKKELEEHISQKITPEAEDFEQAHALTVGICLEVLSEQEVKATKKARENFFKGVREQGIL